MESFEGRVAVITGAGSGIGRALADRALREGMRLVACDVDADALAGASADWADDRVLTREVDVRDAGAMKQLAADTWERFGGVHLLVNNAGVASAGSVLETSLATWRRVLDVNLFGVLHGIRAFVPRMLVSGEPGAVVNVASMAGLTSNPGMGAYNASKHAVVTLSETLHHELTMGGSKLKVSVLCPGWVKTRIADGGRHASDDEGSGGAVAQHVASLVREAVASGLPASTAADAVFDGVREGRFYITTHPEMMPAVERRMRDIVEGRVPRAPKPPGS